MNILQQALKTTAAAGLGLFAFAALQAESLILVPGSDNRTTVLLEGTSNVRDWDAKSSKIEGSIEFKSNGIGSELTLDPGDLVAQDLRATVRIPANSLVSDSRRLTSNMHDYLKVGDHPYIEFELEGLALNGDHNSGSNSFTTDVEGLLTVTGKSRKIAFPVEWKREDATVILSGKAELKMSDFGIDPPTMMFGTLRAADEVTVEFQWVLQPSGN